MPLLSPQSLDAEARAVSSRQRKFSPETAQPSMLGVKWLQPRRQSR
jgi:hypothetical protein